MSEDNNDDQLLGSKLDQISATETETADDRTLYLRNGRSLVVGEEGNQEVLQIAAASGQIELRVRLTEEGPVLQFEGARLELKATEVVDIKCKVFKVEAEESVELLSKGLMNIESEGELSIKSVDDVRVVGKIIYLN